MELGGGGVEGKLNDVDVVAAIKTSIFSLLLPFTCMSSSLIGRQRLLFFLFCFVRKSIAFLLPRSIPTRHLQEQEGPVSISDLIVWASRRLSW